MATISNWLLTPTVTLQNGATLSFWTRTTTGTFPDRLQVRMSTNGASTNDGTLATDVGDFTTLLLDINPTYTSTGYPTQWTQFCVTLSGLASPTTGRLAFRYFVENGGPSGDNSDYIGIDTVTYSCKPICPTPTPCPVTPTPTPNADRADTNTNTVRPDTNTDRADTNTNTDRPDTNTDRPDTNTHTDRADTDPNAAATNTNAAATNTAATNTTAANTDTGAISYTNGDTSPSSRDADTSAAPDANTSPSAPVADASPSAPDADADERHGVGSTVPIAALLVDEFSTTGGRRRWRQLRRLSGFAETLCKSASRPVARTRYAMASEGDLDFEDRS